MKKILLSALLVAAGTTMASAQAFKLYLSNTCNPTTHEVTNYQLINEGDVFNVDEMELSNPIDLGTYFWQRTESAAYIKIENESGDEMDLTLGYKVAEFQSNCEEFGVNANFITCAGGSCVADNPMPINISTSETPGGYGEHLAYQFDCTEKGVAEKITINAKVDFTLTDVTAGGSGEVLHFSILYKGGDASVGNIGVEAGQATYYNLQGIRVDAPEAGQLYIKRQGAKTTKVIL